MRRTLPDPLWMLQIDWPPLIHDLGLGHPLKFLWEERAQHLTTYSNFWKQFYRNIWTFPTLQAASLLLDSGSDCKQYIRPLNASVDAGPDDIRSQKPH
jgi:hypothetical protein